MDMMVADARQLRRGPRACTRPDGRPKKVYPSRRAALTARRLNRVKSQHVYACEPCCGYHLGHSSTWRVA